MLSSIERKRLLNTMYDEPVNARWVLAKCALGLAFVGLLVMLVVPEGRVMSGSYAQSPAPARSAMAGLRAEEHRRNVFVERRQGFQGKTGQRGHVDEMVEQYDRSPAVMR